MACDKRLLLWPLIKGFIKWSPCILEYGHIGGHIERNGLKWYESAKEIREDKRARNLRVPFSGEAMGGA